MSIARWFLADFLVLINQSVYTNFNQWYDCSGEKFFNLWQIYKKYQKDLEQGYKHIEYVIDEDLIKSLQNIKRPNTDPNYIRQLMINQLKKIRHKFSKVRLLYSGGTDSRTILKLAIENDIYIDETITHMVSFNQNIRTNIEYLDGIKFAKDHYKTHIGKITIVHPKLTDLDYYYNENWYLDLNVVKGCPFWLRGQYIHRYMPEPTEDSITLTGSEKPQIANYNGNLFWCLLDDPLSEYMQTHSIYHFFCDKNNPELIASQIYAFIENCNNFKEGHNCINDFGKNTRIDLITKLGYYLTGKSYIDKALIGKKNFNLSTKNKMFIKELSQLGHEKLLEKIKATHFGIYLQYKNIPHGVEFFNGFVKSVARFSKKIPIYQDSFGS